MMRLGCAGSLISLLVLGVVGAGFWYYGVEGRDKTIVRIEVGQGGADQVLGQLSDTRILSPWGGIVFRLVSKVSGADRRFQAGTHMIPRGASVRTIIGTLTEAKREEVTVTIPEGSDLRDIARILRTAGLIGREEDLYVVTGMPATTDAAPRLAGEDFSVLGDKPKHLSLEGYLFPDTYRFFVDGSAQDIVQKMVDNFTTRTEALRVMRLPEGLSFHDVVTLASIIEAEVRSSTDRRLVADLFLRREREGMGLQADSTVNYATEKTSLFTSDDDRATDSLWNTYKYRGLPPGPIGNPGLDALRAVFERTENGYVYFLTAPDGKVHYAKTLDEHNANKIFLR